MGNFNDGLAKVKKEGKFGFIDKKGNFIVNNIYDFVGDFTNGYAIVAKGALYGLINAKGEVVMEIKYSYLGNVYNDVIGFKTTDKSTYGYYNVVDGEFLGAQQYNEIADGVHTYNCSDDGYIVVKQGDYYGILNKKGEYVINPYLLDICFINLV